MGGTFISVRRRPVVILRPGQQGPAWPTFLRETGREFAGPSSSKPDGKQGYGPGGMPGRGEGLARHEGTTGEEHELGVWLQGQRFQLRRGELDPGKAAALDAAVPGWLPGTRPITVRAKLLPSRGILLRPVQ